MSTSTQQQALQRAIENKSMANYHAIIKGFMAKGLSADDIHPRVNVFTYDAWLAKGRQVAKGEKGVKLPHPALLEVDVKDAATGKKRKTKKRRSATVFHFCQTKPSDVNQTQTPPIGDKTLAARLRSLADAMESKLVEMERPMTARYTPKRWAQHTSRLHDAVNGRKAQQALRAVAELHDTATCPPVLGELRSKTAIAPLVRLQCESVPNGYHPSTATKHEYLDSSPAGKALQSLIEAPAVDTTQQKIQRLEVELRGKKIDGFFPTPASLAAELVELADIRPGFEVLEPSAGIGSIAEAIRERYKEIHLICVEKISQLCEVLELKGFETYNADFLTAGGEVDRVVMNPPFEKGQDIDHVRHAYSLLRPGGRIVAVMCQGPFFRSDKKSKEFRSWLQEVGCERVEKIDSAFKGADAFNSTGVSVSIVVIDKEPK